MVTVHHDLSVFSVDELVSAAQQEANDDGSAMNELVARFTPTARRIAVAITADIAVHDDIVQAELIAVVQAVRHHQAARAAFHRYAHIYMVGAARRELRRWHIEGTISLSDVRAWKIACDLQADDRPVGIYHWGYGHVGNAVRSLSPAQQELLTRRYLQDASLEQIASTCNTTKSAVSQRLKNAHLAVLAQLAA